MAHPRTRRAAQQQGGESQEGQAQRRRCSPVASAAAPPPLQQAASSPGLLAEAAEQAQPTSAFDWFDHWFPIAFVKDIPDGQPYGFRLLDQPM